MLTRGPSRLSYGEAVDVFARRRRPRRLAGRSRRFSLLRNCRSADTISVKLCCCAVRCCACVAVQGGGCAGGGICTLLVLLLPSAVLPPCVQVLPRFLVIAGLHDRLLAHGGRVPGDQAWCGLRCAFCAGVCLPLSAQVWWSALPERQPGLVRHAGAVSLVGRARCVCARASRSLSPCAVVWAALCTWCRALWGSIWTVGGLTCMRRAARGFETWGSIACAS